MSVDFDRMAANLPADQRKQLSRQYRRSAKNETTAFLSAFFLGIFGIHHFYLGEWARGFAHLIIPVLAAIAVVVGVVGMLPSLPVTIIVAALLVVGLIWEILDLFKVDDRVRHRNTALAESLIGAGALADRSTLTDAVSRLDSALVGAGGVAVAGAITADDVSAARAMADEHNNAIMEEFGSTTTKYISGDPNATSPGAPMNWTETSVTSAVAEPAAEDTLDMPAPEYVTHTHTETETTVTDSFEYDRSPDATQPMAIPTASASEAATWPDHPPVEEAASEPDAPIAIPADTGIPLAGIAAGAAAVGAGALIAGAASEPEAPAAGIVGPDVTDHHAAIPQAHPIADVEGAGAAPQYVTLPEDQPAVEATVAAAGAPLAVDALTAAHDATDAHPYDPQAGLVADVEANPTQPVYVDLPGETYVPPVVPSAPAGNAGEAGAIAGLAGAGALGAGYLASQADEPQEATPEARPEAAPTSGPLMKRIRMKRQIVVDGQVVREEIVEKLVPVDTDTTSMVAEMDTQLGHASKEEIAHMANLDPDISLDLRQRMDMPHHDNEPPAE
jgi:TM2 domain-containing protein